MTRVAWPFCRAWRTTGEAAKFAREVRENERRSREKNKNRRFFKLLPPQSPRGFSALARLYYLARPTKTAMLRRLETCKRLASPQTSFGVRLSRIHFSPTDVC